MTLDHEITALRALGVTVDDANHTLDQKIASDTLRRL